MDMKTAVIAIKVKGDKSSIKTTVYQVAQLATECYKNGIKIVDCAIAYSGGPKSLIRELKTIDARKRFDYVIVFSPMQVAKDKREFAEFQQEVESSFKCEVMWLRSG